MQELKSRLEKLGTDALVGRLDAKDPLAQYRSQFHIPQLPSLAKGGALQDSIYLCGNSLGLQPKDTKLYIERELEKWSNDGIEAYFSGDDPWVNWDESCLAEMSAIVGAKKEEVVIMNSLTANIHFTLASFYNPTPQRFKILTHASSFPSDTMALRSHVALRGYDPDTAIILVGGSENGPIFREQDFISILEKNGDEIALIWVEGVHYLTGQLMDMALLAQEGRKHGALVGLQLAHAAGNVELQLHKWGVDFAVWCTYKYLNSGPGGIGGCFIHERHHSANPPISRLSGWWGSRKSTRFLMDSREPLEQGALGYQLSCPPILLLATVRASLQFYAKVGMKAFRSKSNLLTGLLEILLEKELGPLVKIVTPSHSRGCQLTLVFNTKDGKTVLEQLKENGIICDFREPNCLRVAPNPFYNSFRDVQQFVRILTKILSPPVTTPTATTAQTNVTSAVQYAADATHPLIKSMKIFGI